MVSGAAAERLAQVGELADKLQAAERELARAEERQVRDADLAAAADEVIALLDRIVTIAPDAPVEHEGRSSRPASLGSTLSFRRSSGGKLRKHT